MGRGPVPPASKIATPPGVRTGLFTVSHTCTMRNSSSNRVNAFSGVPCAPRLLARFCGRSALRRSRLHTEKGQFALRSGGDAADAVRSLFAAVLRACSGHLAVRPWIAANAFRFLRARLAPTARVFEWGAGMSTLWYERHCAEVHAVEGDAGWRRRVVERARSARVYLLDGPAYVNKILDFPAGYFDLVSIDGARRAECFEAALTRVRPGGMLLVDNTDKDRTTGGDLFRTDELLLDMPGFQVRRFVGWPPGNLAPQETTVCVKLPRAE
jgi:Methyltransferase domain